MRANPINSTWYIKMQIQDLEHGEKHDQDRHN